MMKKMFSMILMFILLMCPAAIAEENGGSSGEAERQTLEQGSLPIYMAEYGTEPLVEAFPVYYINGVEDLPYAEAGDVVTFLNGLAGDGTGSAGVVMNPLEDSGTIEIHLDGVDSFLWMDFDEQTVTYTNFNTFLESGSDILMDALSASGFNPETGEAELFERNQTALVQRSGSPLEIHMADYNIPMIHQDGLYLLPLHTAFALTMEVPSGAAVACINPAGIFIGGPGMFGDTTFGELNELGELFYSAASGERSPELAAYGLNEFCMEMDAFYGLKEAHGISSFGELVLNSGLLEALIDPDGLTADTALAALLNYHLDDGHTGYLCNSSWTGPFPEKNPAETGRGFSGAASETAAARFMGAQDEFPDSTKPYFEVGNTAYLYQEEFNMTRSPEEYYSLEITEEDIATDTIALIIYAHRQITRENSPIENVVVDLSCNGGGHADAAVYMLCWFLGEAPISLSSPATGAQATSLYRADINLDHQFDENDRLSGKNLYCLTSAQSFSCGNLVPWIFKASGRVTLLGDTTGGGSCVMIPMSTAWGTMYQASGTMQISFVKNGSYYDVDRGVDPDIFLTKVSTFCDREKLTEIINGLY